MLELDEFCDHCAKEYGGTNSFIGLVKPGQTAHVFCKGCGITSVNSKGECLKCKPNFSYKIPLILSFFAVILFVVVGAFIML